MESSMNSSSFSATPIMSEEENTLPEGRIEEQNTDKKIMGADVAKEETSLPKGRIEEQNTDKKIMGADVAEETFKQQLKKIVGADMAEEAFEQMFKEIMESDVERVQCGLGCNDSVSSISIEVRTQTLNHIMEVLADPNIQIIGLHCSNENAVEKDADLLQKVNRRADRDKMFDVILKATVTNKPNIKKIQDEIAGGLTLKLDEKSTAKRASILHDNLKTKQKILVILCDLYKGIDLVEVGIPYGADHSDCKILLTSASEDVLSNQMHTQINFSVGLSLPQKTSCVKAYFQCLNCCF